MSYKALRQLLDDNIEGIKEDVNQYIYDKTLQEQVPDDFLNLPLEIYTLKGKTLARKNIFYQNEGSQKLLEEFLQKNGDFFNTINIYAETFGQIVLHFISPSTTPGFEIKILVPEEYELENEKVYEIEIDEKGEVKRKLLAPMFSFVIGDKPKSLGMYRKAVGLNYAITLLNIQAKYQAFSVPVAKGLDENPDNYIRLGSNKIIRLNDLGDAMFDFVTPDTKITELSSIISQKLLIACRSENIPEDYITLEKGQAAESGYSIKLKNEPLTNYYTEKFPYYQKIILGIFEKIKAIRAAANVPNFSDELEFTDKTQTELLTFSESMETDNFLLNNGLMDKIDIVMKYRKLDEAGAIDYINTREARKAQYGIQDSVTNRIARML